MGSQPEDPRLPDASDASLVLTHPTEAEKQETWRLNHGEWGGALDLAAYLQREPFLASTPLSANGGMTHWILTETCPAGGQDEKEENQGRRVLASCETLRKRVLYVPRDGGEVRDGLGYGIGSVYTYPQFRGKKYAARLLKELGVALKTWPKEEQLRKTQEAKEAICSALWSDIGKRFYASKGWPVFASEHIEFSSSSPSASSGIASLFERSKLRADNASLTLTPVNASNLAQLCREDEAQLRAQLVRHARDTGRAAFAFAPEHDVFRWHWSREDFIASRVFPGRGPSEVRGMVATQPQARIWAIWARHYGTDVTSDSTKNSLYILRLVVDDPSSSSSPLSTSANPTNPQALQLAFNAVLHSAMDTAHDWHCGAVHLWNPPSVVRELVAGSGVSHSFVHRDVYSIPSMMWYGPEEEKGAVDWIANEKYCWC
ncbi:hypothetical protein F5Y19DRAFT_462897 [Xylariaceae sp. FL1651]|nr:hypothetical protein F5Y19DRAFT_462897 [Xylariaceae sp. FL1651]